MAHDNEPLRAQRIPANAGLAYIGLIRFCRDEIVATRRYQAYKRFPDRKVPNGSIHVGIVGLSKRAMWLY